MSKIITLDNLTKYDELIKNYVDTADAKSIKKVTYDTDTRKISFFKSEAEGAEAVTTVTLPADTDISSKADKVTSATEGDVATLDSNGNLVDGGVKLADISTAIGDNGIIKTAKDYTDTEVGKVNTKIGTVADDTTVVDMIADAKKAGTDAKTASKVTMTESAGEGTVLKTYTFYQGVVAEDTDEQKAAKKIGSIDLAKDLVVTGGKVVVDPEGQPAGTYLKLTIANQEAPVYINVADLVDVYTAAADATEVQVAISDTDVISATLVDGGVATAKLADAAVETAKIKDKNVTLDKLSDAVQASLGSADTALQSSDITTGATDGTISIDGTDVAVKGLADGAYSGFAAETDITALFAAK